MYRIYENSVKHGFEHGRFWYEPNYYDEKGVQVQKSKELDKLFDSFSKYVKKNYKLTADKFAYIGPNVYEKYREGVFNPCSGKYLIKVE